MIAASLRHQILSTRWWGHNHHAGLRDRAAGLRAAAAPRRRTTGCGLPAGPGGSIGALEGLSYLWVVGLVGFSVYTKVKTGKGLPNGARRRPPGPRPPAPKTASAPPPTPAKLREGRDSARARRRTDSDR